MNTIADNTKGITAADLYDFFQSKSSIFSFYLGILHFVRQKISHCDIRVNDVSRKAHDWIHQRQLLTETDLDKSKQWKMTAFHKMFHKWYI